VDLSYALAQQKGVDPNPLARAGGFKQLFQMERRIGKVNPLARAGGFKLHFSAFFTSFR